MTSTPEINTRNSVSTSLLNSYRQKVVTAERAAREIKSGDRILVHSNCAVPFTLLNAIVERKNELHDVEFFHALAVGELPYLKPGMENSFRHNAFFIGHNARKAVQEGKADYTPIYLSEIPHLFSKNKIHLNVALIHVSPPDEHGFCSLGVEVGITKTGAEKADMIIAQVNRKMPRVLGDSFIHINKIKYFVEVDEEILELPQGERNHTSEQKVIYDKIASNISELIEDGSTLQMGIGAIPDAVLKFLKEKKHLGIHTEMFSDGVIELVEQGIITNERKTLHNGKIIAGFVLGSKALYNFINNNPLIEFHPQEYVNDPFVIARNTKMVAINSALEVDITGQVCADSIGPKMFSGFGGQLDFIRGASRADGGKPIIALPSTTKDYKISRIVPHLRPGAGVVTGRGDVHYVVTEYGVADLYGKSLRERIKQFVNIAHPDFKEELLRYARDNKLIS